MRLIEDDLAAHLEHVGPGHMALSSTGYTGLDG